MLTCSFTQFLASSMVFAGLPTMENEMERYCPGPFKPVLHCVHSRDFLIYQAGINIPVRALPFGAAFDLPFESKLCPSVLP